MGSREHGKELGYDNGGNDSGNMAGWEREHGYGSMAGASPVTTILPCAAAWLRHARSCMVVAGLAPAMFSL